MLEIERLRQQILEPPLALTVLGSGRVCVVQPDDPISVALDHVRTFGYSQLPVYDGDGYRGVLTTNAIARWLADQLTRNTGIAEEEPVSQVLAFAEPGEDAILVSRTITVVDAIDKLSRGRQARRAHHHSEREQQGEAAASGRSVRPPATDRGPRHHLTLLVSPPGEGCAAAGPGSSAGASGASGERAGSQPASGLKLRPSSTLMSPSSRVTS